MHAPKPYINCCGDEAISFEAELEGMFRGLGFSFIYLVVQVSSSF